MDENIIISKPELFEKIKHNFKLSGANKFHVVADFDRTLTQAFVNGEKIPSLMYLLREENILGDTYTKRAQEYYEKYYPIELDPNYPIEKKKKMMQEWWEKIFDLLIESKLNIQDIERVIKNDHLQLRGGTTQFLNFLKEKNIPLIIISSNGLGDESISAYLENRGKLYKNIHIVSNSFEWDNEGYAKGIKKPIIHVMNKDETSLSEFPFFREIKDRKNVLLLGDSLGDVGMVSGFKYKNLIKVGFLNEEIDKNLEKYKENFDVVILNDSDMSYVNEMMKEIIK